MSNFLGDIFQLDENLWEFFDLELFKVNCFNDITRDYDWYLDSF